MQLSNWNPFKFIRKQRDARKAKPEVRKAEVQETALAPVAPSEWLRDFLTTKSFVDDVLRDDALSPFRFSDSWFGDFSPPLFRPSVDVVDQGDALCVSVELPGLEAGDVSVTVDSGTLVIAGEKSVETKHDENDCYRVERAYGSFRRVLPLPRDVDPAKVDARMDKGVLTLRISKVDRPAIAATEIPVTRV